MHTSRVLTRNHTLPVELPSPELRDHRNTTLRPHLRTTGLEISAKLAKLLYPSLAYCAGSPR